MIANRQRRIAVAVGPLSEFLARAQRELGFPEDGVTVRFVSDSAMSRLNRTYRDKAGPTDVLSFPTRALQTRRSLPRRFALGEVAGGAGYAGDIAISPETARRNARRYSRTLPEELRVLVLHGLLHLAGFDHEVDEGQMERIERRLRRRLGLRES